MNIFKNDIMIPKHLFFIWIGNNVPNYVNFSINSFKKFNPDFEIEFIHESSIYNDNKDFKECLEILKEKNHYSNIYNTEWRARTLSKTETSRNIRFSDALRHYIINKYGGIYLDCDTYPIKPFDDKLLNYKSFGVKTILSSAWKWVDIFFMGAEKDMVFDKHKKLFTTYSCGNIKILQNGASNEFYQNRLNFTNCIENFDLEHCIKNEYIIHFKTLEWAK